MSAMKWNGATLSERASARRLVFPVDPVTKDVFQGSRVRAGPGSCGEANRVLASSKTRAVASYGLSGSVDFAYLDLLVMAAVAAIAKAGTTRFPLSDVVAALGYRNAHAASMEGTVEAIAWSLSKLSGSTVWMSAVRGAKGRPWLDAVKESPLVSTRTADGYHGASTPVELDPPDPGNPLSALPFLVRAEQANQVVGIAPDQMPSFAGRRVSLVQRQLAMYITVRALERLPQPKVLLETMLRCVGVDLPAGDAGRQARTRMLRQLTATLESMSAQGTVIGGYKLELDGSSVRAIVLQPVSTNR